MQFIEDEEALHLLPSASLNLISPIPSQPFPFLKLPREIRDSIYYYALLHDSTGPGNIPNHICYFRAEGPVHSSVASSIYWGTEKSTRLFRVNHQISYEALKLFYSTYFFHFPPRITVTLVNATIRDTLTPWARSLITTINFRVHFFFDADRFMLADEEERRQGIEAVMKLLPNVKRVGVTLSFVGHAIPEYQVKGLVARALRIASPLRRFDGLVLDGRNETTQRVRILREVREALGCL